MPCECLYPFISSQQSQNRCFFFSFPFYLSITVVLFFYFFIQSISDTLFIFHCNETLMRVVFFHIIYTYTYTVGFLIQSFILNLTSSLTFIQVSFILIFCSSFPNNTWHFILSRVVYRCSFCGLVLFWDKSLNVAWIEMCRGRVKMSSFFSSNVWFKQFFELNIIHIWWIHRGSMRAFEFQLNFNGTYEMTQLEYSN